MPAPPSHAVEIASGVSCVSIELMFILVASAINAALSTNYFLVNSKFSYLTSKRKGNVFLEITNLTNTPYSDLLGAIMPSRWIAAGFQLTL